MFVTQMAAHERQKLQLFGDNSHLIKPNMKSKSATCVRPTPSTLVIFQKQVPTRPQCSVENTCDNTLSVPLRFKALWHHFLNWIVTFNSPTELFRHLGFKSYDVGNLRAEGLLNSVAQSANSSCTRISTSRSSPKLKTKLWKTLGNSSFRDPFRVAGCR
jgi:hypothetical protein